MVLNEELKLQDARENLSTNRGWKGFLEVECGGARVRTYVEAHGQGVISKGEGFVLSDHGPPPVFVIIGALDRGYRYWPFDEELVRNGFTVVGFDLPGQLGRSENLPRHTMADYAKFYRGLISGITPREVNVVALSMSVAPTLMMAAQHPEIVKRLVLVGGVATIKDRACVPRMRDMAERKGGKSLERIMAASLRGLGLPAEGGLRIDRLLQESRAEGRIGPMTQALLDLLLKADATEACGKITAPTLFIAGEKDLLAPPKEMEETRLAFSTATHTKLLVVPTGHGGILGGAERHNPRSTTAILEHLREG